MNCVEEVRKLIAEVVRNGDQVIDATMGNGHDTLALAEAVGGDGFVWGFDVQREAVRQTAERLRTGNLLDCCRLIHGCHSRIGADVSPQAAGCIRLVLFNLGYLPGSDKSITTRAATTLQALRGAFDLLAADGRLVVTAYTGHPGGYEEALAVRRFYLELASSGKATNTLLPEPIQPRPCLFITRKNSCPGS